MTGGLAAWFQRIRDDEARNYWPGPRPLGRKDPDEQLVGRAQDVRDILKILRDTQMIVLSGATGDGKSSLLDKGVLPTLVRRGNLVLHCNQWSGTGEDVEDGGDFLQAKLADQLPDTIAPGSDFMDSLDSVYGARACIVLDQFEELIRHEPVLFDRICSWIAHVVQTTQVRIVVSLREEYLVRLRAIDVGPYARRDFVIEPIREAATIETLLRSGRRSGGDETIEESAVERLLQLWGLADGGSRARNVGLLHLQALLYVLWRERPEDGVVSGTELRWLEDELLGRKAFVSEADRAVALFQTSLAHVVGLRLELCEAEYRGPEIDGEPTLATGAARLIRRMSGHLSSGGYKVDQDRWHLAELVLDTELATLGYRRQEDRALAASMFADVSKVVDRYRTWFTSAAGPVGAGAAGAGPEPADYLSAPRAELVGESAALVPAGTSDPWDADPLEVTGGMMMGATPSETLLEVYRLFFFALEWLEASFLVRQTSRRVSKESEDETTVSLIHDGFGRGLVDWAAREEERPGDHFGLLIAAVGDTIHWDEPIDGSADPTYRYAVNLRWKSCLVTATLRHITFVNGDFRNSTFVGCEFEGVTFVNCLLDGVSFSDCRFRGPVKRLPEFTGEEKAELESSDFDLLSFTLPLPAASASVVRSLSRYRELAEPGTIDELYSLTSGLPATPSRGESAYAVPASEGGLLMYGGRLSSLVFGRCEFPDDGSVALRDLAGTSLEFAEQAVGSIELRNVALRGLTISAPLDYESTAGDGIDLHAYYSLLQNVWISAHVPGSAVFDDCPVWQLANGSTTFRIDDEKSFVRGRLVLDDAGRSALEKTATKVDYRSTPAKRELLLRRAAVQETGITPT